MKDLMQENKCECCKTNNKQGDILCYNCATYCLSIVNQRIELIEQKLKEIKKCI